MAITATTTASYGTDNGVSIVVYGPSGVGKTRLAGTLPVNETVILSLEHRLLSLRGLGMYAYELDSYEDVMAMHSTLANDPSFAGVKYIVVDSATEAGEKTLVSSQARIKDGRQAYQDMQVKCIALFRLFRDMKKHVVLLFKEEQQKDALGNVRCGPSMPGQKLGPQIPYLFDEVFYMGISEVPGADGRIVKSRYLLTDATSTHVAKDASGSLDQYEPPDLLHIINKIQTTPPKGI